MTKQPTWLDWLVMLLLAAIWGISFLFIKRSVQVFNPVQMAMWRMVLATAVYLPIAAAYWSKINWKNWKPLLVVAFCGSAIPNFLFAIAGQHIPSGLAGVLNSLTPLFTLISGMMFFQLQANWIKITGVLLGLGGALMLVLSDHPDTGGGGHAFYAMLCVLATVCYAINSNVISKYLRDQPPAAIASAAFILTGGLFLIGLWWSDGWQAAMTHPQGLEALGYIGYLAAFGTVVGSIIYFWLLQRTGALFATSVTYLLPIVALAVGLLDNETVTIQEMLGTGIILTGLWLTKK